MPRGRPKGSPNRVPRALKEMILGALNDAGGQDYLKAQAKENPNGFLTLIGKVLPLTIAGDKDNPVHTHSVIEQRIVDPDG